MKFKKELGENSDLFNKICHTLFYDGSYESIQRLKYYFLKGKTQNTYSDWQHSEVRSLQNGRSGLRPKTELPAQSRK